MCAYRFISLTFVFLSLEIILLMLIIMISLVEFITIMLSNHALRDTKRRNMYLFERRSNKYTYTYIFSMGRIFLLSSKTRFSQTFQIPFYENKYGVKRKGNLSVGPRHGRRRFSVNIKNMIIIFASFEMHHTRLKGARYTGVLCIIIMTDFTSPTQPPLIPRHIAAVLPVYNQSGGRGSHPAVNGSI